MTIILFIIELLIAIFTKGFIRNHVGDVLVVILIYTFFRTFWNGSKPFLLLSIFLFAILVEIAQAYNLTEMLHIHNKSTLGIIIGCSFDWGDILCYAIGIGICYFIDTFKDKKNTTIHNRRKAYINKIY